MRELGGCLRGVANSGEGTGSKKGDPTEAAAGGRGLWAWAWVRGEGLSG